MAKPNYRFFKQQRELKKSKQQAEKQRKKLARAVDPEANVPEDPLNTATDQPLSKSP